MIFVFKPIAKSLEAFNKYQADKRDDVSLFLFFRMELDVVFIELWNLGLNHLKESISLMGYHIVKQEKRTGNMQVIISDIK